LFLSLVFAIPRGQLKQNLKQKKAPSAHKQPVSNTKSWHDDLSTEERATLLQLENEIHSAANDQAKIVAKRKHHTAAMHMISHKQRERAVSEFHARQRTKTRTSPSYENLPDDLKSRLEADGNQYVVRGGFGVTDLNFRFDGSAWEWSPDNENWQTVRNEIVAAGDYAGDSPVQSNIDLLNRLHSIQEGLSTLGARKYQEIKWYFRGFISSDLPGGRWMDSASGCGSAPHEYVAPLPRIPLVNALGVRCFRTDSRSYSSTWDARSRFNMKVIFSSSGVDITPTVTDSAGETVTSPYSDYTEFFVCEDSWLTTEDCGYRTCQERSSSSDLNIGSLICYDGSSWSTSCSASSVLATFHISGDPGDPCTPPGTPGIDFYGGFTIAADGHVYGDGAVDAFPWFESGVVTSAGETQVWTLAPLPGKTPFDLYGGANRVFHVSASF